MSWMKDLFPPDYLSWDHLHKNHGHAVIRVFIDSVTKASMQQSPTVPGVSVDEGMYQLKHMACLQGEDHYPYFLDKDTEA